MLLEGTVVNGHVQLDEPTSLPDGTRVSVEPVEKYEYPHPMAPYDREKELALLRQAYADVQAGVPGISVDEMMAVLDAELQRLANDAED